jgi:geranylgeranyl diphosphate synthase type II
MMNAFYPQDGASSTTANETREFETQIRQHVTTVHEFLRNHLESHRKHLVFPAIEARLLDAVQYSLLQKGSKRYRPCLALLTAQTLGRPVAEVLPFAAAVEMIHTYSLIHDDLPCMDNDDFRRGEPTNHKVFGETFALLAGDSLQSEAFTLIAENCASSAAAALRAVALLARAAGGRGMVLGQTMDLSARNHKLTFDELKRLHDLKTGALIQVSVTGAAELLGANAEQMAALTKFAAALGFAFQLADDLLDFDESQPEAASFATLLGARATQNLLVETGKAALESLRTFGIASRGLERMIKYNQSRSY